MIRQKENDASVDVSKKEHDEWGDVRQDAFKIKEPVGYYDCSTGT